MFSTWLSTTHASGALCGVDATSYATAGNTKAAMPSVRHRRQHQHPSTFTHTV